MSSLNSIIEANDYNMLDVIFKVREEKLATMISHDINAINKTANITNKQYAIFKSELDKIPEKYKSNKHKIIDAFNEHNNALEYREGYFNEKYYKECLREGVNIVVKCLENK